MLKVILWPFWLIWAFVGFLFELVGRFLAGVIGLVFILIGCIITATVIGAIIGIPLIFTGFALLVKAVC